MQSHDIGNKRQRLDSVNSTVDQCPISENVLSSAESWAKSYNEGKPYRYGVIPNFCRTGFLEQVLHEIKQNSTVKFKESDLFKVYQSIDFSNLTHDSDLARKMPTLMQLKDTLYSPDYRAFMEKITNLEPGTLTDETDCAANCHTEGCHLLCHDDVIGNRKISYIIYLTDPEHDWCAADGGQLELYDSIEEKTEDGTIRKVPNVFPSATVLPTFNSMAYFAVVPGQSFHSVQEVFASDKPRLSIQGWYHAKSAPENAEDATLRRLKSAGKGEDTELPFVSIGQNVTSIETSTKLTEEERTLLKEFINETYLTDASIEEIRLRFEEDSSVQLRHFLNNSWAERIQEAAMAQDENEKLGQKRPPTSYDVGVSTRWNPVGPAHKQRFLEYCQNDTTIEQNDAGSLLDHVRQNLCVSTAFCKYLQCITSLCAPEAYRGRVRRFRPGLDYTVAHYGILTQTSVLDATLCFVCGNGKQCLRDEETGDLIGCDADAVWESGEVGGFECYISADDEEEESAEAVYNDDDDTELLSVSASNNTLSLVYRDPGTMRFVKYIASGAPSSRWDIALEYKIPPDENEAIEEDQDKQETCPERSED